MDGTMNWKEAWARKVGDSERVSTPCYWNARAKDYSAMVKTSDCNHGRMILEYFLSQGILQKNWNVLDIASGPGAVTIPFAEQVQRVTAVEPAEEMATQLRENAHKRDLTNIDIIPQIWQDVNIADNARAYDMVICCHALWQFSDLITQVRRMEAVSRGYCCLAHGIQSSETQLKESLGLPVSDSSDEFSLAFNYLNDEGITPNVNMLDYSLMWPEDAGIASKERYVEKYRPLTDADRSAIRSYIAQHTVDGIYHLPSRMGILWWKVEP
ncbi:class I SAM-dependent methyltransferase [Methanoregula sp.]|uniref:class I SAM-dependent methyltransferase n=1 Tax=Methanoregula sp. TaxID=2052170 RepID=UPI000CC2B10B|nr:class I SAM-dependent methyltransferase [Methanoregula sp.]PKG31989.1 MAG: class I SAM-dependent methyltransferase [Methanoregula sp.]